MFKGLHKLWQFLNILGQKTYICKKEAISNSTQTSSEKRGCSCTDSPWRANMRLSLRTQRTSGQNTPPGFGCQRLNYPEKASGHPHPEMGNAIKKL